MMNLKRWWVSSAAALLSTVCQAQNCRQWQQAIPEQPGFFRLPVVYDAVRARQVVPAHSQIRDPIYGNYYTAMWEWDGRWWTARRLQGWQFPHTEPGELRMAFDEARGRVVAFDGTTWELIGDSWVALFAAAPRDEHAMTYDSIRSRVMLYGGFTSGHPVTDTRAWDGQSWTLLSSTGPGAREAASMAFDSARDRIVLFGGAATTDTWEWDGTAWTRRAVSGPPARMMASMAYDPQRHRTVLFGGYTHYGVVGHNLNDTWEWDGSTWTPIQADGPSPRSDAAMNYDPSIQRILFFGGGNGVSGMPLSNEVWSWDGAAWTLRGPGAPAARRGHGLAYDSDRQRTVLFGGYTQQPDRDPYTWERADGPWVRRSVQSPPARVDNAMAYDPHRHRTVLFGGSGFVSGGTIELGDTWEWDGSVWVQTSSTGPSPRHGHGMIYDPDRHRVVLYGGSVNGNASQDMWEWDGAAWTQLPDGPRPVTEVPLAFDTDTHRLTMYLGFDGLGFLNETWEWDGQTWSQSDGLPGMWTGRSTRAFAFDPVLHRILLFGGYAGGPFGDLWERDGHVWTRRFAQSFFGRADSPMIYDEARSCMVLFGGWRGGFDMVGDTLELPSAPARLQIISQPADQTIPNGGTATFSVVVDGDGPFTYQWYMSTSAPLVDGTETRPDLARSISGATTSTLVLTGVRIPPWGNTPRFATCVVANACNPITSNTGRLTLLPCGSPDFDFDGSPGTDADIEAFFACLAGTCCPTCGNPDFNGDGDTATDADIEAFFRVLAGGPC